MRAELAITTDKCVRNLNDGTVRKSCGGQFMYHINEEGYIARWRCLRCGWLYTPTYKFKRNQKPYTLGIKCYKMKCKVCSEENDGLL